MNQDGADSEGTDIEGEEKDEENKKKKGKSKYLIDREKNIENNRKILAPFFKDITDALEEWKEEEQAIKKMKNTTKTDLKKDKDEPIRRSTQKKG